MFNIAFITRLVSGYLNFRRRLSFSTNQFFLMAIFKSQKITDEFRNFGSFYDFSFEKTPRPALSTSAQWTFNNYCNVWRSFEEWLNHHCRYDSHITRWMEKERTPITTNNNHRCYNSNNTSKYEEEAIDERIGSNTKYSNRNESSWNIFTLSVSTKIVIPHSTFI